MTYFLTHTLRQLRRRRRRANSSSSSRTRRCLPDSHSHSHSCSLLPAPALIACASTFVAAAPLALPARRSQGRMKEGRRRKKVCTHIFCSAADGVGGVAARVDIKILINPRTLPRPLSHSPQLCPCLFGLLHLTEKRQLGKSSGKSNGSPCGTHIAMRRRVKRKRRICVIATAPLPFPLCPLRPQLS